MSTLTVLVVPVAGDPADIAHGATHLPIPRGMVPATTEGRPPRALVMMGGVARDALPLMWDGQVVDEAWDRARRVLHNIPNAPDEAIVYVHEFDPTPEAVLAVAVWLVRLVVAERVLRLVREGGLPNGRFVDHVSGDPL